MSTKNLTGTGVAIVTPFRNDGSIDFKSLEKLIEHIIEGKADYVVALGTTGETPTLSKDEKKAVVSSVVDAADGRLPVVIGIGGNNTQEVLTSFNNYDLEGISAVLSVSPYYNKPSQQGIYQHFKAIAQASPLPVIIYNVPGRTGSNICADTTVKLAKDFKNIIAVKEASGNLTQIMQIIKDKPAGFSVISGDDALTLPMISAGASGVISVIANACTRDFSEMVRLALKHDFIGAAALHYRLFDLMQGIFDEGSPSGIKAVLEHMKITQNYVRLPLVPVSEKLNKKLGDLVKGLQ